MTNNMNCILVNLDVMNWEECYICGKKGCFAQIDKEDNICEDCNIKYEYDSEKGEWGSYVLKEIMINNMTYTDTDAKITKSFSQN